jgi:ribonuclease HI
MAIRDSFSTQATVCRDNKGHILYATSQISRSCSPNEGEAMAAQLALSVAKSLNMDHFIIEGDSEVVVNSLNNPNLIRDWRISSLILDSLESISFASFWEARKISRNANFCAHSMVHWVAVRSHFGSIPLSSIPFVFSSTPSVDPPLSCIL